MGWRNTARHPQISRTTTVVVAYLMPTCAQMMDIGNPAIDRKTRLSTTEPARFDTRAARRYPRRRSGAYMAKSANSESRNAVADARARVGLNAALTAAPAMMQPTTHREPSASCTESRATKDSPASHVPAVAAMPSHVTTPSALVTALVATTIPMNAASDRHLTTAPARSTRRTHWRPTSSARPSARSARRHAARPPESAHPRAPAGACRGLPPTPSTSAPQP